MKIRRGHQEPEMSVDAPLPSTPAPLRQYEVMVVAAELSDDEAEALFDRVAEAAHSLDQQVICSAGWAEADG